MKELLKKKTTKIGIAVIVLVVAVGIISISARSAQRQREYDGHVEAAERYLTELDYEQAIAEYTLALEIEPNAEEVLDALEQTYLDYAKSYADTGDYEKAIGILEEGYTITERESLKEQIEEYAIWQEIKEQEEAESVQREEVKQLVESVEFWEKAMKLYYLFADSSQQYITDEQIRELCWPMIEAMEQYRVLYPENLDKYIYLPYLYFLAGEYELCAQVRAELHEQFPDEDFFCPESSDESGRIMRDEYGRVIWVHGYNSYNGYDLSAIIEVEYGQNGRVIRVVNTDELHTYTYVYEYDSEGRISKATNTHEGEIRVMTYEYSEGGFTLYENYESSDGFNYKSTSNFVIDEYGRSEQVGERVTF